MAIVVTICGLVILLAFEIRHREMIERMNNFEMDRVRIDQEILRLKDELKKKQNAYQEYKPPML